MPDARTIRGRAYVVTRERIYEAGCAGASIPEIAEDPEFDHHVQPQSAVRRAVNDLLADGLVEAIDKNAVPVRVRWIGGRA